MLFGRAQEEISTLTAAGVPYEVVPGVTAAFAASADIGTSLTQRGVSRNVVFVTPRTGAGETAHDWATSVAAADTAVIYMGAGQAATIAGVLISRGLPPATPAVVVENASLPHGRSIRLTLSELPEIAELAVEGPATIMLGKVFSAVENSAPSLPKPVRAIAR